MSQILSLSAYSAKAVSTVLLVALAGALLVRFKFIKEEALKTLSQIVFAMMLPCLLFSKVAKTVDLAALRKFWTLPFSCFVFIMAGLALGWLVAKLCRAGKDFFNGAAVATAFGNSSYIPIPLITAMTIVFPDFQGTPNAASTAVSYISLYLMLYSPLMWSVGYTLISGHRLKDVKLLEIVNPPLIGMLCGIVVGTIPPLKGLFCGGKALLSPVFDASEIVGVAAVPCSLIVLGGRLAYGPIENTLKKRLIVGVALAKLVALPVLAIFYVKWMVSMGLMPDDRLLALTLVIEGAVPQATNLAIMCSLKGDAAVERNMASLLFWNYLAAVPTLTAFIMISMWLFR